MAVSVNFVWNVSYQAKFYVFMLIMLKYYWNNLKKNEIFVQALEIRSSNNKVTTMMSLPVFIVLYLELHMTKLVYGSGYLTGTSLWPLILMFFFMSFYILVIDGINFSLHFNE